MFNDMQEAIALVFQYEILLAALFGVTAGIIVGAIPGLSDIPAISLLLPFTFYMHPVAAISMLMGLSKGSNLGGSIPAILFNLPGTGPSVVTAIDGYPLSQQGKSGKALKMAIFSSSIADASSDLIFILLAAPVAALAILVGPPEYTAIVFFSLVVIATIASENTIKGMIAIGLGLLLSAVSLDPIEGSERLTFGSLDLMGGFGVVPLVLGLFVVTEVLRQAEVHIKGQKSQKTQKDDLASSSTGTKDDGRLTREDIRNCMPAIFGGTMIGAAIGAIPGIGSGVASYLSYMWAKRISKNPKRFGNGALDGVAASEAGNNAVVGPNLIPLITLGVPGNVVAALVLGAFMIQGLSPGPFFMENNAHIVYAIFFVMLISNVMNVAIALLLLPLLKKMKSIPVTILYPSVLTLSIVGCYVYQSNIFDVYLLLPFGLLGYVLLKVGVPVAPVLISFILGSMMEERLRQSLQISGGDFMIFLSRPVSLAFLLLSVVAVLLLINGKYNMK